jgi:hypothetical protein
MLLSLTGNSVSDAWGMRVGGCSQAQRTCHLSLCSEMVAVLAAEALLQTSWKSELPISFPAAY